MTTIEIDGNTLTLGHMAEVARGNVEVRLSAQAVERMNASRTLVESWVSEGKTMYGVTTGFGEFSNVSIDEAHLEELQRNLIMSHAVGCGDPMPYHMTRILMLLRANALAKGYSGIRVATVEHLLSMLNQDIIPVIPSQGSVGSSGDLVQLAHLVLGMMGIGSVQDKNGSVEESIVVLQRHGLSPVVLRAKEGLALINGTQMMTAYVGFIVSEIEIMAKQFDIAATMSLEALFGTDKACSPLLHQARPHIGQQQVARNVLRILAGSEIRESHRFDHEIVQDAYSLRCIPQVHGASRDAFEYVKRVVLTEINSATDNPLIFPETGEMIEGGNFHGQPIALAADFLGIALSELANISERRIERMVNGKLSGLPRFLTQHGGLHSGMMIAQYTAASLVSENKVLAHPASVDSIPTSANQEDHNSMGSIAARKAYAIFNNCANVLAIEFLTASQALDFHAPKRMGTGTGCAHAMIRKVSPHLDEDRVLYEDLRAVTDLVRTHAILDAVENEIGKLE